MTGRSVVITGGGGMLAHALAEKLPSQGLDVIPLTRQDLDVTDGTAVVNAFRTFRPAIVIHCAGFTRVDEAEIHETEAYAVNAMAAGLLAEECHRAGALLIYPSTDYVFDGRARRPYEPMSTPAPLNAYGRSKLAGEAAVRAAAEFLIVRTSWLYGGHGRNFVRTIIGRFAQDRHVKVVHDQRGSPTWASDLADILGLLIARGARGVFHAANAGDASWFELALEIRRLIGAPAEVEAVTTAEALRNAQRPAYSVLDCSLTEEITGPLRNWRKALAVAVETGEY